MPEIRIPLYGMVTFSDLEWALLNTAPFQRLRRIRQLAWSDMVYPGAVHTRFEHSIGVMHLVSRAFDTITSKPEVRRLFSSESGLHYTASMWDLVRQVLRLAALLHDLGHLPFSHAAENEVFPTGADGKPLHHEDYSAGFILHSEIRDVLEHHPDNAALSITAEEIAGFLGGKVNTHRLAHLALWRGLISGELDADRMDYLLRDSYHLGVEYGRFDVDRVLSVLTFAPDADGTPRLSIEEGGLLAVEALILARYYMYHQVYFHKVRRFLDAQYATAFCRLLQIHGISRFAPPDGRASMEQYAAWDDWKTQQGLVEIENECEEARRVVRRECFKVVLAISSPEQERLLAEAAALLERASIPHYADQHGEASSHRFNTTNILVRSSHPDDPPQPIQYRSQVAMGIPSIIYSRRLYVPRERRADAMRRLEPVRRRLREESERRARLATPAQLAALAATRQAPAVAAGSGTV